MMANVETELEQCRAAYVDGRLTLSQLERATAHVLRGGYLDSRLALRSRLMDRVRQARICRRDGHNIYTFRAMGSSTPYAFCARCGRGDQVDVVAALQNPHVRAVR